MVLRYKGASWQSHLVDMKNHANKTPWFLGINPRGLVPVLVDDGRVVIESNDIVDYIDAKFPPSAADTSLARHRDVEDELHLAMRTLTFNFAVPPSLVAPPADKIKSYRENGHSVQGPGQDHGAQIAFWDEYAQNGGSPPAKIIKAYDDVCSTFCMLDAALQDRPFLSGKHFSLVDIVWFPTVRRLVICGIDLDKHHPRLARWHERCSSVAAIAAEAEAKSLVVILYQAYQHYILGTNLEDAVAKYRSQIVDAPPLRR